MSIQQPLDGHSFSLPEVTGLRAGEAVEVELLAAHTLLVPAALYGADDAPQAAAWFAMSGMPLGADECVVVTEPEAENVALIGVRRDLLAQIREKWGPEVRFTTPLLHVPADTAKCVWLYRAPGMTYIKVYDASLRYAEVLASDDDTELLYFFDRLAGCFPTGDSVLRIAGNSAKSVRHLIGKRFKKTICE